MKVEARLITVFVLRLLLVAAAVWVALSSSALPPGTHWLLRVALAAMFLVVSILLGEVATLRTQFELFLRALRSAGVQVAEHQDPVMQEKEAVNILIRALGSREATTREKAYKNLIRLTGQDLPPEKALWEKWWKEHREAAKAPESGA